MNANIQGLLIATGQNLKRLLAATGWRRRHAPCGSLTAPPGSHSDSRQSPGGDLLDRDEDQSGQPNSGSLAQVVVAKGHFSTV